jgi:hypothetical protein
MIKRKHTPTDIETEALLTSARRCCICYGLDQDFAVKKRQIAHLDGNPANSNFENLAFLCFDHHDEYDSKTRQSKGLNINEVKEYRAQLHETVAQMRRRQKTAWSIDADIPRLEHHRSLDTVPSLGLPFEGISLTDQPEASEEPPTLYVAISFKTSPHFLPDAPQEGKWLYLEANMRPALNLRIQVQAYDHTVEEVMKFLREDGNGWVLFGLLPVIAERLQRPEDPLDLHARDQLSFWRENDERRMMISTYTATNAGISIHARLSDETAEALASYLERIGFASQLTQVATKGS